MATQIIFRRNWISRIGDEIKGAFRQIFTNPVIGREIKVRVRFARSFVLQGAYLACLLLIVAIAYLETLGHQIGSNPYSAQRYLQEFYQMIFVFLTVLIVLIAPALTAAAITMERERRTIDLLLATPLKARDLLTGKLLASFAFLLLLLALSMPASAVCVLLGGATIGEALATYAMLAFDGLLICALALVCSTINRQSGRAVFWAYLLIIGFLAFTVPFAGAAASSGMMGTRMGNQCLFPIGVINPFVAPFVAGTTVPLFGYNIPTWALDILYVILLTRLVLTIGARWVGLYDHDPLPSLRRQLLGLTAFFILTSLGPSMNSVTAFGLSRAPKELAFFFVTALIASTLCLLLFTPWIATYGPRQDKPAVNDGWFRPLRMLRPSPAGALPFLYTWLLVVIGSLLLSIWYPIRVVPQMDIVIASIVYSVGLITLFWTIGRFCSAFGLDIASARVLAVGLALIIFLLPIMISLQQFGFDNFNKSPWLKAWFLYPLTTIVDWYNNPFTAVEELRGYGIGLLMVSGLILATALWISENRVKSGAVVARQGGQSNGH